MCPKVSVIILIYQVENYIERCARSLFEQTLDDIEYIFWDDCTTDKSIEILKRVLNDYPQRKDAVRIYHNEQNLGQAQTRMEAIKHAHGDYVVHCDSDDWVDKEIYEKLYRKAINEDLDIVWCDFYRVNEINTSIEKQAGKAYQIDAIKEILIGKRMGPLWNHLIRRDLIICNTICPPIANLMEDVVLLIQYYIFANNIGYIPEPLYYYYHNPKSVTYGGQQERMIWQVQEMSKNISVIERFLQQQRISYDLRYHIEYRKFFTKSWLQPVITSVKDCKIWINTYREINFSLFFNPLLSCYNKMTSGLIMLRLYPFFKKVLK